MINPQAFRSGLILSAISVVWTILTYLLGIEMFTSWGLGILIMVIMIIYIIVSLKKIKTQLGGYISFADAFLNFMVIAVIGLVIGQIFNYLLIYVIDPEFGIAFADATIEKTIAFMEGFGAPESAIEEALVGMEEEFESQTSISGLLSGMFKGTIFMGVVGVIVAAIMKKKPDVFNNEQTID